MYYKSIICLIVTALVVRASYIQANGHKLDCHPIDGASKEKCEALGCLWEPIPDKRADEKSRVDEPWCYFPEDYEGYQVTGEEIFDIGQAHNQVVSHRITLKRVKKSALGQDVENVAVELFSINNGNMLRLRITDFDRPRFEPELPKLSYNKQIESRVFSNRFKVGLTAPSDVGGNGPNNHANSMLTIRRASSGIVLFSTDLRRLIFSDRFIQLNTRLNSPHLFGLGEHFDSFLKLAKDKFKTYSFWNTDKYPRPDGQRSYGGFPFYINLEQRETTDSLKSQAHGVYLRNSNAMDIVLQPDMSVTFRPTGGLLDFYFLSGPKPLDVVSQFQNLVGLPDLPPRWALGFHLCRYNYGTLEKTKLVWQRTRDAGIPFDVQWNDIDYMEFYNDFTYDPIRFKGLPEFVDEIHKSNMYYMLLFDPGLSQEDNYYPYELGEKMDIWIKNATNQALVGKVWNKSGRTVFPDFANPLSGRYWSQLFVEFQQKIKYDGAWIDMNDISNFVEGSLDGCPMESSVERPPYRPGGYDLQEHTLCLSARHYKDQLEFDLHSLYSFYEAIATHEALLEARPNKRSLIISRSTHPGQGHYGGHWSGDVLSNWEYLRWSIPSLIEHSMYGFSMMGTDICGFEGNTTPELCARWSTLGAFYTFSRNHNDDTSIDQDPVALGPIVIEANKNAYKKRYSLLPYLYTLLHRAHMHGEPVARSLSFEFFDQLTNDLAILTTETQFMIGSALMVSSIVEPNTYSVESHLPRGKWYETDILPKSAQSAPKIIVSEGQKTVSANISLDNLVLFLRGGHIIPMYTRVGPTTLDTVKGQPYSLEVALCRVDRARGSLIYDDGESIDAKFNQIEMFAYEGRVLNLTMQSDAYEPETRFGQVKVYGLDKRITKVKLRDNEKDLAFTQDDHMLNFNLDGAALRIGASMIIEWY